MSIESKPDAFGAKVVEGELYPGITVKVWETGGYNIETKEAYMNLNVLLKSEGHEDEYHMLKIKRMPKKEIK